MLKVFNDLTNKQEEFKPIEDKKVRMYVCGPTVYDSPHLGHARSAISFDLIRKYLEFKGYEVNYVMNYTDIDDKMIRRANEQEIDIFQLAEKYIGEYEKMLSALDIKEATTMPRATGEIDAIIDFIKILEKKDFTYESEGSLYFDTSKREGYKTLFMKVKAPKPRVEVDMSEEERYTASEFADAKRNIEDFVLWKQQKPGEPAWDSPWGKGRPGWHIECSTMSMKYLGETIDIHGGGKDLKRPHHQNEIAQSEAATGQPFVNYWIHNGFLNIDNTKMSKSLGNFIELNELIKDYPGTLLRFYYLRTYYSRPMNFSLEKIDEAKQSLLRLQSFYAAMVSYTGFLDARKKKEAAAQLEAAQKFIDKFFTAMDTDFNSANAIGQLFGLVNHVTKQYLNVGAPLTKKTRNLIVKFIEDIDTFLGFITTPLKTPEAEGGDGVWKGRFESVVNALLEYRQAVKKEKNYAMADKLRTLLSAEGVQVSDTKDGFSWELKE